MQTTRTAAGAMVALMAVLVAGCGGSDPAAGDLAATTSAPASTPASTPAVTPTPTPKPTPVSIAGLSTAQILAKTQAAAKAANSVHVKGDLVDGKDRLRLDVRLARAGGGGSITMDGDTVSVIVIGKTAYLRMSNSFWRKQSKSKAEANAVIALIGGRWIKTALTNKDLGDLAVFASKTGFFDGLFEDPGTLKKTAPKTVDGVPSIGLKSSDGGTLWVDVTTARPVRLDSPSKTTPESLTFTEYNQVAPPKAPPAAQVIDGKALGL